MFYGDDYYDEADFYKEQERQWYQNQYATKKKKHTFDEALMEFEKALLMRVVATYDDHCQPFPVYRRDSFLVETINGMRKKFPKDKRFSYQFLEEHWTDEMTYWTDEDWYHCKRGKDWCTGKGTNLMELFITKTLIPYVNKARLYQSKSKATFVLETPKTPIIEPKKEEPVVVAKAESKGKGRPKGSKNKTENLMKPPTHNVNEETIVAALQDIIWYQDGLKANEIIQYINADEKLTKKIYGKLHENAGKLWEKRIVGQLYNGKKVERYYPLTTRKGYYYEGEMYTLNKLAEKVGMAKQTLSYRINKGMNHVDAINVEIKEQMRRK